MKQQDDFQPAGDFNRFVGLMQSAAAAFVLFAAVCAAQAGDSAADASAYAAWIKPWAARPVTSAALGDSGLTCIVTTVRGEVPSSVVTGMTPLERLDLAYRIRVSAAEVATNGYCHFYFVSNTETKSSNSASSLTTDHLNQLRQLLDQLPEDNLQLPPPGRRIVVQVLENGQWHVRVYDGNKVPPEVKAILGLLANPFDKII
jgi:hypothetical protein